MTGVPPFDAPSFHSKPIVVADLQFKSSSKLIGASGLVKMIAPFPDYEIKEFPNKLIATIFA